VPDSRRYPARYDCISIGGEKEGSAFVIRHDPRIRALMLAPFVCSPAGAEVLLTQGGA
jgi:hypothetical protein